MEGATSHLQFPTLKEKAEKGAESGRHQLCPLRQLMVRAVPQNKSQEVFRLISNS